MIVLLGHDVFDIDCPQNNFITTKPDNDCRVVVEKNPNEFISIRRNMRGDQLGLNKVNELEVVVLINMVNGGCIRVKVSEGENGDRC